VTIHEYNNESNVLFPNKTYLGPHGQVQVTEPVPQAQNETTWAVKFTYVRNDDANTITTVVGPRKPVLGGMPGWLVTIISLGSLWIVAGLFSQLNGTIGAVTISAMAGVYWYVDFLPPGVGLGVIMLALIMSGILLLRDRQGASAP
jgi:hypothetical protein